MDKKFSENAFDILRLYAALQVMLGHAQTHLQVRLPKLLGGVFSVPGVVILFAICGYLITASVDRAAQNNRYNIYFKKRFLRIFPGLWACVVINFILIFVIYSVKPDIKDAIVYLGTQLTALNFYTGDWLREYGVGAPNGSLWTIFIELQFYIAIVFIWRWLKDKRLWTWIMVLGISMVGSVVIGFWGQSASETLVYKLVCESLVPYLYFFLIGAMLYKYRDFLFRLNTKWYILIIALLVAVRKLAGELIVGTYVNLIDGICICVLAVLLAYICDRGVRLPFDISYGIYLYHMVFINAFVELGYIKDGFILSIAVLGSIIVAFVSWNVVEKRAIGICKGKL